jgi:hypothetical protein
LPPTSICHDMCVIAGQLHGPNIVMHGQCIVPGPLHSPNPRHAWHGCFPWSAAWSPTPVMRDQYIVPGQLYSHQPPLCLINVLSLVSYMVPSPRHA